MKSILRMILPRTSMSPPSRGAWIEIQTFPGIAAAMAVAPLAGGVD